MAATNPQHPTASRTAPDRSVASLDDWGHVLESPALPASAAAGREARIFRPVIRRPMALVHVIDDGREHGEAVRMRGDRIVIGRTEGDILIPHDLSMSPRHAVIERLDDVSWQLADADSIDGTFVRVVSARLHQGTVIRVGSTTLRFEEIDVTEGWFVEVGPRGTRHVCHGAITTLGRTGCGCQIGLNDAFVSPCHVEIHRTPRGWRVDNTGMNGLWVRLDAPVRMHAPSQFLCGEQRFVFEPLLG